MGFLMDTNVLSELRKDKKADRNVREWFAQVDGDEIFLSVLTLGEIRNGIERIRRRDIAGANALEIWLHRVETEMVGRILPVTDSIADYWGRLGVPDPLPVIDSLLAATASVHGLTLVTRNVADIERTGVAFTNPFKGEKSES
jgi:predicted nucleic acid-binding protein